MIKALRSKSVFACGCKLLPSGIYAGILILSEDFEPGYQTVFDIDSEQGYQVWIYPLISPQYKVVLPYAPPL